MNLPMFQNLFSNFAAYFAVVAAAVDRQGGTAEVEFGLFEQDEIGSSPA